MEKSTVTLKNISKKYGAFTAVDDIDLVIQPGEFVTLLGPSGCAEQPPAKAGGINRGS